MSIVPPPVAGPDPGQPGHFAHHEWAEDAILALDAAASSAARPYAMAAGATVVALANQSSGFAAFTFPVGRFAVAPIMAVNQYSGAGGSQTLVPRVINATAAGATAYLYSGNNALVTVTSMVHWHAVQMTAGSAAG